MVSLNRRRREIQQKDFIQMSTEKKSEKLALYVALIASMLALILTIVTYLVPPSGTLLAGFGPKMTPPPSRGPGFRGPGGPGAPGGRVMRGASPSAAILQKYDEQIRILERLYQKAEAKGKSAENAEELQAALLRLDIGRLNRMSLQKGRRVASSFADAYLAMKCAEQNWKRAEQMVKDGKLEKEKLDPVRLALNEAEIRLLETERRLNPEKVAEAKEAVREYPANLTEEQLETLLAAERRFRCPR